MEISYRGKKNFPDLPNINIEGLPLRYCPVCLSEGKDSFQELEIQKSSAFVMKLKSLINKSDFSENLTSPHINIKFNPAKIFLAKNDSFKELQHSETLRDDRDANSIKFFPEKPMYSFDRLILNKNTMTALKEALTLLNEQKLIYEKWNLQSIDRKGKKIALNFFGEPGTGKTLAADAIANYLGKDLISVSYAELESKYVGETPKNIKAAFQYASESGSILFFDEADSILGKRLTQVSQATDHSVNLTRSTTLIELDKFNGVVIFASNLVQNYDTAFLRRMIANIEFSLPEKEERVLIWKSHLPPQLPLDPTLNIDELADISSGASGADIKNAVLLSASIAAMRAKEYQVLTLIDFKSAMNAILDNKRKIMNQPVR